jgi:succinate dehydrogenase / fumarate reductase flavoprotein subunit
MGGIHTDINGLTSIEGIYAAGESGCVSVHGANRLGGNSLLDILIFGRRAGNHALAYARHTDLPKIPKNALKADENHIKALLENDGKERIADVRRDMGNLMANKAGIYRNATDLTEALESLTVLKQRYKQIKVNDQNKVFNTDLIATLELGNMLELAEIVTKGALERTECRGAHYREDFPKRDDKNWLKHTIAIKGTDGKPVLKYEDVTITRFKPEERTY